MESYIFSPNDPDVVNKLLKTVTKQCPLWMSHIRKFAGKQIPLADYDDILSRFYEKVLRQGVKILNTPVEKIHFYLITMIENEVKDYFRGKKRRKAHMQRYADFLNVAKDHSAEHSSELRQAILHFFQRTLSAEQFEVMKLGLDGYPDLEIGKILRIPKNTISTLKRRSRLKLQSFRQYILSSFL